MNKMSSFSNLLSYHIHNSGKSKIQIAEAIGMPRTNFQKISTGARKLQNEHVLEKIMNELILSVKEKKELWEEFHKDTSGKERYEEYLECINLLNEIILGPKTQIKAKIPPLQIDSQKETFTFRSQDSLVQALSIVLSSTEEASKKTIRLLLQPENSFVLKLLIPFLKSNPDVHMQHIICFDHHSYPGTNYSQKNVCRLKNTIRLLLASQNYAASYYYDNSDVHFQKATLFPNIILTNNYLLSFDNQENRGFLTKNKDLIALYADQYADIFKQTSPIFLHHAIWNNTNNATALIAYQPQDDLFMKNNKQKNLLFFIENGFCRYIKKSITDTKQSKNTIIAFLEEIKHNILTQDTFFLLKENYINLPTQMIFVLETKSAIIKNMFENKINTDWTLQIQEQSIIEAFHRLFQYMPQSLLCYSKEETLQIIDHLLADLL